jgi:hypothetical protein
MINENEEELSIQQKAHLNLKAFSNTVQMIAVTTICFMSLVFFSLMHDAILINNILAHYQNISVNQKNQMATISLVYNQNDEIKMMKFLTEV